jgi:hypothetical protein
MILVWFNASEMTVSWAVRIVPKIPLMEVTMMRGEGVRE